MHKLFVSEVYTKDYIITGEEAFYITKVLRAKKGEKIILTDKNGVDFICEIAGLEKASVHLKVLESHPNECELSVKITLLQCLPKGSKMDFIIQKAVELGVFNIIPIVSENCAFVVPKKDYPKKQARWQKIAEEAARQSKRGIIPKVMPIAELEEALTQTEPNSELLVFYENAKEKLSKNLNLKQKELSILIGPEGGFAPKEIEFLQNKGAKVKTLGKRILRTETASIVALSILGYLYE